MLLYIRAGAETWLACIVRMSSCASHRRVYAMPRSCRNWVAESEWSIPDARKASGLSLSEFHKWKLVNENGDAAGTPACLSQRVRHSYKD